MNTELSEIRINQEGYAAGLPVSAAVLAPGPVTLKNAAGETLRVFSFDPPRTDPASGDQVTLLDLGLLEPGEAAGRSGEDGSGCSTGFCVGLDRPEEKDRHHHTAVFFRRGRAAILSGHRDASLITK